MCQSRQRDHPQQWSSIGKCLAASMLPDSAHSRLQADTENQRLAALVAGKARIPKGLPEAEAGRRDAVAGKCGCDFGWQEDAMANVERVRQVVTGQFGVDELKQRIDQGWKAVAIDWERELPAGHSSAEPIEGVPFGLRVAADCTRLEENPEEQEVLLAIMELTIQDGPYSGIAEELNRRGYRTRDGYKWTPISVFHMLPRLIEVGPRIFSTPEWQTRRQRLRGLAGL